VIGLDVEVAYLDSMLRFVRIFSIYAVLCLAACNDPSDYRNYAVDPFCKQQKLPANGYRFDHYECKDVTPDTCAAAIHKLQQKGCKEGPLGHDRLFCCD